MNTIHRARELADSHGLTLFQMAEVCDIPYSTLKSASQRNTQLNVDTIERICGGLKITMSEFFRETPEQEGADCNGCEFAREGICTRQGEL